MKKYKVQITESQTYILDIKANTQEEAEQIAEKQWDNLVNSGTYHYHEDGDLTTGISHAYNVTNTDDPFNSLN